MQTDLEFRPRTTIDSNGSRWFGQAPATVDELLAVLAAEPLERSFEIYGNFITSDDGETRLWGNFHAISHVFSIGTRDPDLIERLTTAIRSNQQRPDYLAQPVPAPLPPCPHCDPTATPPSECGRH